MLRRAVSTVKQLNADPGIPSLIPTLSHTFVEIDHWNNLYSKPLSSLPLIQEGLLSVTSESVCTKFNRLAKLAQEKSVVR